MRNPTRSSNNKTTPCCGKVGLKRGPWTPEEDQVLSKFINKEGEGRWRTLPKRAGLLRCGKSCRLRWMNYLRPSVKRGHIDPDEEDLILRLHRLLGNRYLPTYLVLASNYSTITSSSFLQILLLGLDIPPSLPLIRVSLYMHYVLSAAPGNEIHIKLLHND